VSKGFGRVLIFGQIMAICRPKTGPDCTESGPNTRAAAYFDALPALLALVFLLRADEP
jgi:hypothetical protein